MDFVPTKCHAAGFVVWSQNTRPAVGPQVFFFLLVTSALCYPTRNLGPIPFDGDLVRLLNFRHREFQHAILERGREF